MQMKENKSISLCTKVWNKQQNRSYVQISQSGEGGQEELGVGCISREEELLRGDHPHSSLMLTDDASNHLDISMRHLLLSK